MKSLLSRLTTIYPDATCFHVTMLFTRVLMSVELMAVHGFKKLGIGVQVAETIPNPLHLPEYFNSCFAIAANMIAPLFVIAGLMTRIAVLPILMVTLTGYFVLHWNSAPQIKDVPFVYSIIFLGMAVLGPGKYSLDYLINKKHNQ